MKLLLDTHIFLWLNGDISRIPDYIMNECEHPENQIYISVISIWEVQIKHQLGKLELSVPLEEMVKFNIENNGFSLLSVDPEHIYQLKQLPNLHKDPFDRLLISQTQYERLTFVTLDQKISLYDVELLN